MQVAPRYSLVLFSSSVYFLRAGLRFVHAIMLLLGRADAVRL